MPETRDLRATWLHARFAPTSYDAEARTVEVVWSTGAGVRRRDWEGEFTEVLDMSPAAVDLARLQAGAPVLNSHDAWDLDSVLGVVERAWLENGEGRAVLRFSERAEVAPILADIRDGILRNISVGYDVERWEETKGLDGKRIKRAVRWQPAEISLVPIPADASAQVRAAETPSGDGNLPHNPSAADAAEENPMPNPGTPAQDSALITDENAIRSSERATERARLAELRSVARVASRSLLAAERVAELEDQAVQCGMDARAFQAQLFDEAARATESVTAPTPRPIEMRGGSSHDPASVIDAMGTAIAVRALPSIATGTTDQRWREFSGLRISDMIMELAAARGERVSPRLRTQLVERAFHTSSDFPMLLENAGNKMLEAGFTLASPSYRQFFARRSFNDFKAHSFLTAGDFPALEALGAGGEIKQGTMSEKRERITPATYAKGISVTRQMLINDDLGAFQDFGAMIGRRTADYENSLAYGIMNTASGAGPTLTEGNLAVFSTNAARANRAGTGAAISEASLDEGYAAIMAHTSLDGLKLNLQPRFLLTGPAYRGPALRYTARISPEQGANVGLYSDLTPVSDAYISGNRWYLLPDPNAAPIYAYGYVNGAEAPQIRVHQYVPGTDGISVEVVHDFGVGAIGWRGGWFNPGA